MSKLRDYFILIGISGVVIALDQGAKYLVRVNLSVGESWSLFDWLSPFARIVHWNNTGAAFGLFKSGGMIFTGIAVIVSLAILYYFPRVPAAQLALRFALALQLGGAVGNLIDRLLHGTVTDFISVGTFPVFNLADASISIGTAILVATMWTEERRARREDTGKKTSQISDEEESVREGERPAG